MLCFFCIFAQIFTKDQRALVTVSNYALVFMLGVLSIWISCASSHCGDIDGFADVCLLPLADRFGFAHFATRYLLPYLHVNFWLIL